MDIFRDADVACQAAPPASFSGAVRMKRLAVSETGPPTHVYRVEFAVGGRTNWHSHSGPQWLFVVAGGIRVQAEGEVAVDLKIGDAVVIPPGQKHWHGASPDGPGVHLAVNINAETTWMEPVTDGDYVAPALGAR